MKARDELGRILRFGCVGLLATAVHYGVALLVASAASPYLANLAGYGTAVGVSYFGHHHFTFRPAGGRHGVRMARFVAASLSALALSLLVLALARAAGLPESLALALAALSVPPYSFVLSRVWVFRRIR